MNDNPAYESAHRSKLKLDDPSIISQRLRHDCVKKVFNEGAKAKDEYSKFRHAIICEMKDLGLVQLRIKELLREWNEKGEYKISAEGEIRRQLDGYVDWAFKKDIKIGCTSLKDFCLKNEGITCIYDLIRRKKSNEDNSAEPHVSEENILSHLKTHSLQKNNFIIHAWVWKALKHRQLELSLTMNDIIFIGYRDIARIVNEQHKSRISPREISRAMQELISTGLVILAYKGKEGEFKRQSNGYIRRLPDAYDTHINSYVCKSYPQIDEKGGNM
jgi:hypothetical protein